jgi:hypothetical protein
MLGKMLMKKNFSPERHTFLELTGKETPAFQQLRVEVSPQEELRIGKRAFLVHRCRLSYPEYPTRKVTEVTFESGGAPVTATLAIPGMPFVVKVERAESETEALNNRQILPFSSRGRRDPFAKQLIKRAKTPGRGAEVRLGEREQRELLGEAKQVFNEMKRSYTQGNKEKVYGLYQRLQVLAEKLVEGPDQQAKRTVSKLLTEAEKMLKPAERILMVVQQAVIRSRQAFEQICAHPELSDYIDSRVKIINRQIETIQREAVHPFARAGVLREKIKHSLSKVRSIFARALIRQEFAKRVPQVTAVFYYLSPSSKQLALTINCLGVSAEAKVSYYVYESRSFVFVKTKQGKSITVREGEELEGGITLDRVVGSKLVYLFRGEKIVVTRRAVPKAWEEER